MYKIDAATFLGTQIHSAKLLAGLEGRPPIPPGELMGAVVADGFARGFAKFERSLGDAPLPVTHVATSKTLDWLREGSDLSACTAWST